jgi:hypothetical protein
MSKADSSNYLKVVVYEEKVKVKVDFRKSNFRELDRIYFCDATIDRLHPEFSLLDVVCATDGIHVGNLYYDEVIPGVFYYDEDEVIDGDMLVTLFCGNDRKDCDSVDLIIKYGYDGWNPQKVGTGIEVPYKEIKKIVYTVEEKLRNEEELEKWLMNKGSSPEED